MTDNTMTPDQLMALLLGDEENAKRAKLPLGIEAQEMDGQETLVTTPIMPRDLHPDRESFEKLGFVFGKVSDGIFFEARLPEGWHKKATDHPLHSLVLDDQGRIRARLFYKAAFYDRMARCQLLRRYGVHVGEHPDDARRTEIFVWDFADDKQVHCVGSAITDEHDEISSLVDAATKWLDTNYPEHKSPLSYW